MEHKQHIKVTVIIDAFRAFATACYILDLLPQTYIYTSNGGVIEDMQANVTNPLLVGKNEIGQCIAYHIPNSPTRVTEVMVANRTVMHRTEAGAKGVLAANNADIILCASFVNAQATVIYIQSLINPNVTIIPMGHEAVQPSLEDDICAQYIESLMNGETLDISPFIPALKLGPGRYFFGTDQWQYPEEDFHRCLDLNVFDFAIKATLFNGYATLTRCI